MMTNSDPIALGPAALAEAKDYLRVQGGQEDALIARAMEAAAELCEQFTGEVLLVRSFTETLRPSAAWTRLARTPVRAILSVEALGDGPPAPLPAADYAVDVDAGGRGWVRVTGPGDARRIQVTYSCGLAAGWAEVPEALRQGTIRLAAHLYTHRGGAEDRGPPAAVTALWRPYRRMRLA